MDTNLTSKERIEERRSWVRVTVTYAAAAYVFIGSLALIAALWIDPLDAQKLTTAKDVFMMVLPVATGIITYWFASRKPDEPTPKSEEGGSTTPSTEGQEEQNRQEDGGEQRQDDAGEAAVEEVAHEPEPPEGGDVARREPNV